MKFKLHDIRESKVWKEAHNEGKDETNRGTIQTLLAKGMSPAQIAELLNLPLDEVRRLMDATA
jgi:predicted transposase YdaD